MIKAIKRSPIIFYIILTLTFVFATLEMLGGFRGLGSLEAMDQAQIARNISLGRGNTSNFIRPLVFNDLANASGLHIDKSEEELKHIILLKDDMQFKLQKEGQVAASDKLSLPYIANTQYAPLYIWMEAGIFKTLNILGADLWANMSDGQMIYTADRILAILSCLFFIASVILSYTLLVRLFDPTIALFSCIFMIISSTFLSYAISGLPIMFMLFLFTIACHNLLTAIEKDQSKESAMLPMCIVGICFALICITGWLGLWPLVGLLVFITYHFKSKPIYLVPIIVSVLLAISPVFYLNYQASGSIAGSAIYSIYTSFLGDDSIVYRAINSSDVGMQVGTIFNTFFTQVLTRIEDLYDQLGKIILAPVFFLALFHTFKIKATQSMKWALLIMWAFTFIGVSLFTPIDQLSSGQLQLLFSVLFSGYGLAFILVLAARLPEKRQKLARIMVFSVVLIFTALPFILTVPDKVAIGQRLMESGRPLWPPYFAYGLNKTLDENTKQNDIILSDQPWAVAWYANRPALWVPKQMDQYKKINQLLNLKHQHVAGLLVSPSSIMDEPLPKVQQTYGEFTPFMLEGAIVDITQSEKPVYITDVAPSSLPFANKLKKHDARIKILKNQLIFYRNEEE